MSKPHNKPTHPPKDKKGAPASTKTGAASRSKSSAKRTGFQAWWAVIAGVVLLAAVWAYWFLNQPQKVSGALPAEISVDQAYAMYQDGVLLVDVRQPEEWNEYHIPNTTLIPLGLLESGASELPKDQPIVVVCRTGNRSQEGRELLMRLGFDQVTSMTGGVNQWKASGYPTVSGP